MKPEKHLEMIAKRVGDMCYPLSDSLFKGEYCNYTIIDVDVETKQIEIMAHEDGSTYWVGATSFLGGFSWGDINFIPRTLPMLDSYYKHGLNLPTVARMAGMHFDHARNQIIHHRRGINRLVKFHEARKALVDAHGAELEEAKAKAAQIVSEAERGVDALIKEVLNV
ncbi:hypothetical protein [Vibrio harveyi]|uniref:hypothetical protein n=1 Tax=Vibrio harveyi TaxID=669 RepID=UPI0018F111CE|nr:hypothetical protein [Vibrio harveyi]